MIKQILCQKHQATPDKIEYWSNATVRRSRSPTESGRGKKNTPITDGDKHRVEPWEIPEPHVFQGRTALIKIL